MGLTCCLNLLPGHQSILNTGTQACVCARVASLAIAMGTGLCPKDEMLALEYNLTIKKNMCVCHLIERQEEPAGLHSCWKACK